MKVSASGASDVQVQTLSAEAWGGGLEQREPVLQLGGPEAERGWGEGGPGLWKTPKGAGLQVRLGIHLHTQPLCSHGVVGAGGHGSGVGPRGQVLEAERAPLRRPDRPEPGTDGPAARRGESEVVETEL